jgi:hypothetical protein
MLLNTSEQVSFLRAPEFTGAKRLRAWLSAPPEPEVLSPLDIEMLRRKYGPDNGYRPWMREATFRVEYGAGMRKDTLDRKVKEKVDAYINAMSRQGFDVDTSKKITVYPGMCPSIDMLSGLPLLGERDLIIRAWFVCRAPKVERIELDAALFEPTSVAARSLRGRAA